MERLRIQGRGIIFKKGFCKKYRAAAALSSKKTSSEQSSSAPAAPRSREPLSGDPGPPRRCWRTPAAEGAGPGTRAAPPAEESGPGAAPPAEESGSAAARVRRGAVRAALAASRQQRSSLRRRRNIPDPDQSAAPGSRAWRKPGGRSPGAVAAAARGRAWRARRPRGGSAEGAAAAAGGRW